MSFATRILDLSAGPVDLSADPDFAGRAVFVQNVGTTLAYLADRTPQPAVTDGGHVLGPRDAMIVDLEAGVATWIWSRASGSAAVSPAE